LKGCGHPLESYSFTALCESFEGVGPDRLQHPKTRLAIDYVFLVQEAVVHQRGQTLQDIKVAFCVTDSFSGFKRETTYENAETGVQSLLLLILVQQAVTPFERIAESLMPGWEIACKNRRGFAHHDIVSGDLVGFRLSGMVVPFHFSRASLDSIGSQIA